MSKLSLLSGIEAVKAFEKLGYRMVRQKGSHMRLLHPSNPNRNPLTIPRHKTIGRGLMRKLIRDANLDLHEFNDLL